MCFGGPLTRTRSWQPGQGVAKTAWSSIYGHVTSQHFRPVNQILTSNEKATFNLLKWLLGFKLILYLMPSTQHTQACVFIKITVQNWFFLPQAVRDRWPGPRTKWKTRSPNQGTGVTRSWGPGFGSRDLVMVRVAKTHPKSNCNKMNFSQAKVKNLSLDYWCKSLFLLNDNTFIKVLWYLHDINWIGSQKRAF